MLLDHHCGLISCHQHGYTCASHSCNANTISSWKMEILFPFSMRRSPKYWGWGSRVPKISDTGTTNAPPYNQCTTIQPVQPVHYNTTSTTSAQQYNQYNQCTTIQPVQPVHYNTTSTTSAQQYNQYNQCTTIQPVQPVHNNTTSTTSAPQYNQYNQ